MLLFFLIAEFGVRFLEDTGTVDTHGLAGTESFLEDRVFRRSNGALVTTEYAARTMVRQRFDEQRADRPLVFLTGGSFAQGAPYTYANQVDEGFGGIASWVRLALAASNLAPEFINVAAGGQNSRRVRRIVEELITYEPDAIVVATCNNEASVQPPEVIEQLHKVGVYRLLAAFLDNYENTDDAPPPLFVPSSGESLADDRQFLENLEAMAAQTGEAGIPLLLATVPLNIRFGGYEIGHGPAWRPLESDALVGATQCAEKGRAELEAGDTRNAIGTLSECGAEPSARELLEKAYAELWRGGETSVEGELLPARCVAGLVDSYREERFADVVKDAALCESAVDALYWSGLALAEMGERHRAQRALEQAAELRPQGRCRPTFNEAIRRVANEHAHITLVDLDQLGREMAPKSLPGVELFSSNCHLRWSGYWAMGQRIAGALEDVVPSLRAAPADKESAFVSARKRQLGNDPWEMGNISAAVAALASMEE